jgi:carbon storage regulator CsrA
MGARRLLLLGRIKFRPPFKEGCIMLVLTRKLGEEILIGDNIRITVARINGNRVALGIGAPDSVRILRAELQPIAFGYPADEGDDAAECHLACAAAI